MSFLKDSISYSSSRISSNGLGFIRGLLIRIILIPEILGIYNFIQVILSSLSVIDFGASAAASRELPLIRGSKDFKNERITRSTVLWFSFFQSILISMGVFIYAYYNHSYINSDLLKYLIVISLLILSSFNNSYEIFFSAAQKYISLSKILFITSIIEFIFYISGAYFFSINGLLFSVVISSLFKLIISFYFSYQDKINSKIEFSILKLKQLLMFGFPLRLIDYPMQYMLIVDLIWITKFMDIGSLAIYTTAQLFFKQSNQISSAFGTVFETRIIQFYGKNIPWFKISNLIKSYMYIQLLIIVPIIIWIGSIFIPFILRHFLSNYTQASDLIVYLLLTNFFIVINSGLTIPWFIKKKLKSRGISNFFGLLCLVITLYYFWFFLENKTLISVVKSVIFSYLIYFVYMLFNVGKELWSLKEIFKILIIILLSFSWTSLIIIYSYSFTISDLSFINDLFRTITIGFISLISLLPIIGIGLYLSNIKNFLRYLN